MPPNIKKQWKWLVVTVYRAESLPIMDGSLTGLSVGKTDAFFQVCMYIGMYIALSSTFVSVPFQVEFAGGHPQTTMIKTVEGDQKMLNPEFSCELWYPVSTPTTTQIIKCSMWDCKYTYIIHTRTY